MENPLILVLGQAASATCHVADVRTTRKARHRRPVLIPTLPAIRPMTLDIALHPKHPSQSEDESTSCLGDARLETISALPMSLLEPHRLPGLAREDGQLELTRDRG